MSWAGRFPAPPPKFTNEYKHKTKENAILRMPGLLASKALASGQMMLQRRGIESQ